MSTDWKPLPHRDDLVLRYKARRKDYEEAETSLGIAAAVIPLYEAMVQIGDYNRRYPGQKIVTP